MNVEIYYEDVGNSVDLGNIVVPNRRDSPFECSVKEEAQQNRMKKKFF